MRSILNSLGICRILAGFVVALLAPPSFAFGQSDSWNIDANQSWSTASNWLGGTPPGTGGIATFGDSFGMSLYRTITNDTNPTLSGITFDTNFSYRIGPFGTSTINLNAGSAFTLNAIRSNGITPSVFGNGHTIESVLAGSATVFNKTGNGIVSLTCTNTFTAAGGINITAGELRLTSGDAALGNAINTLNIDGGALRVTTVALTSSRAVSIGSNGAIFNAFDATRLNGTVSGNGILNVRANVLGFTIAGDASGFTGAILHEGGKFIVDSNGVLGGSQSFDIAGELVLTNTTTNNNDRINDARALTSRGSLITLNGNDAGTDEKVGNLVLETGGSTVSVVSTAATSSLTFTGLTRNNRSTAFFRGTNLGTAAASSSQIAFGSSPGMQIGGGGALTAGVTNISILPFAAGSTLVAGTAPELVSWDSGSGNIYVLADTNYAALGAAGATDNVKVSAVTSVNTGGQTINALNLTSTLNGNAGDVLSLTSGTMVASGTPVINANVNFGGAEGVLINSSATIINGVLSGANGFTKSGAGGLVLRGSSTYSGTTSINGGQINMNGVVTGGIAGAFGTDSSDIVINSNSFASGLSAFSRIWVDGGVTTTFNRGFVINTGGTSLAGLGTVGGTEKLVINGNVQINNPNGNFLLGFLQLGGNAIAAESVEINGVISGNGGLRDTRASWNILNGNNTYSGGTNISSGTYQLGHDNAFGTGKVWISNHSNIQSSTILASGGPRVIANNFDINSDIHFIGTEALTLTGDLYLNGYANDINNFLTSPVFVAKTNGVTFAGNVFGGSLFKYGAGNLTLTNSSNAYTGSTTVSDGTLTLGGNAGYGSGVLGTNPNTTFGSSGTLIMGSFGTAIDANLALVTNGAFTIDRSIQVNGPNTDGTSTIGGTNTAGISSFNGRIHLGRPTTQLTAATGGTTTFNGQITSGLSLSYAINKVGGGTVVLTNNNLYTGGTTVSLGTLLVNNSTGTGTGVGIVTVKTGATLGGSGFIGGAVTVNGILAPGTSIESLASGTLTLNATSTYRWEALNNSATGADLMRVNGALTLNGGTLDLGLADLSSSTWALGDKLTLISYAGGAITGGFSGFADDTVYTFGTNQWTLNYNDTMAGTNYISEALGPNNVTFTLTAVPEPTSLMLISAPAILLAMRRRRR